ncbi:MAG: PAS domain S-box protein [Myxococcales bacterium]|nr:PAS domain S-box protein [Myxococcales bacterium]
MTDRHDGEDELERLRESEARYRAYFAAANDCIVVLQDDRFVDCNASALELFGCSRRDQLIGSSPADFSPELQPDGQTSVDKAREHIEAAFRGEPQVFEWRHARLDGTPFEAEVSINRVELAAGMCLQAVVRDISQRVQLLQAVQESEATLQAFIDALPEPALLVDEDFKLLRANRALYRSLETNAAEAVGRTLREFLPEPVAELRARYVTESIARGKMLRFDDQRGARSFFNHVVPVADAQGRHGKAAIFALEVTERVAAEEALRFEAGFRRVLGDVTRDLIPRTVDEIDDGIVRGLAAVGEFIDADRCYIFRFDLHDATMSNTYEWCRAGIKPQQSNLQRLPLDDFAEVVEPMRELNSLWIPDVSAIPDSTSRREFEAEGIRSLALVPIAFHGECVGFVGFDFVRARRELGGDVINLLEFASATLSRTLERKAAEEQKRALEERLRQSQKLEAIGRLAGGVAHDFNNMLCAIIGYADILSDSATADKATRDAIDQINIAADRAAELTGQLLAFSRKQMVEPKVVGLGSIIKRLHPMLSRLIGEHIVLRTTIAPRLGRVRIDPSQVEQIVLNLAVNARDAMPRGGELAIETSDVILDAAYCRTRADVTPGNYVLLAVSDTGDGMSAQTQARLFEPFFTTKELGRGTGLGLSTVYGIVEQSGGSIEVDSELGRGTSFKVYFPRVDAELAPKTGPGRRGYADGSETVLVVEDEKIVRTLASRLIARLGYNVLQAASGDEALKLVEKHDGTIDLLMTDVVMPGMNGRDLAERVVERLPHIKVLYSSGYTQDVIASHGVIDEDVRFIAKPYTLRSLAERIREVLDGD